MDNRRRSNVQWASQNSWSWRKQNSYKFTWKKSKIDSLEAIKISKRAGKGLIAF